MALPFSPDKYDNCSKKCFDNTGGDFSVKGVLGGSELQLSYAASVMIDMAAQLTGESAVTIAGTYLIESNGGNLDPVNNFNPPTARYPSGTVDIGPMQLNYYPGSNQWSPDALGTNRGSNDTFNGNAWLNIFEGASYLKTLADPGWYVSGANPKPGSKAAAAAAGRDASLAKLAPDLTPFFNCLNGK